MTNKIKSIIKLLRFRQYYKNALVFVGLFFSENLFDFSLYIPLILGFILLCAASSINYIINDLKDIEKDKKHPEKLKKKPLASGEVSREFAIILIVLLGVLIVGVYFLFINNLNFIIMVVLMIITGQLYNHLFKKYAFIDILSLSIGYLWRALAGCFLINVMISAWLFLAIIEVALFLVIAKRKGDLILLGDKENAIEHKAVYSNYSLKLLEQFHIMIATSIFVTYALYLIDKFNLNQLSPNQIVLHEYLAILTVPILIYILMRFMYLTSEKPDTVRNAERALFDKGIILGGLILGAFLFYAFYFDQFIPLFYTIFNI
jgi:4-hydroxybenzoate polyprenyltransferase